LLMSRQRRLLKELASSVSFSIFLHWSLQEEPFSGRPSLCPK
jgi:hypothetical protein